jgi:hypothetical protein
MSIGSSAVRNSRAPIPCAPSTTRKNPRSRQDPVAGREGDQAHGDDPRLRGHGREQIRGSDVPPRRGGSQPERHSGLFEIAEGQDDRRELPFSRHHLVAGAKRQPERRQVEPVGGAGPESQARRVAAEETRRGRRGARWKRLEEIGVDFLGVLLPPQRPEDLLARLARERSLRGAVEIRFAAEIGEVPFPVVHARGEGDDHTSRATLY